MQDSQNQIGPINGIIRPLSAVERLSLEDSLNWLADGFRLERPVELDFIQSLYD